MGLTEKALPSGWAWSSLGEACEITQGQSPPGSTYNTDGVGLPFFQGKAEFGDLYPEVRKWTTDARKRARRGAVLMSVRAPVGPTNLAPFDCAIGRGLSAIEPRACVDRDFVFHWIRCSASELAAKATGTTFSAVSGRQVAAHPIPMAPLAEQRRIVATLDDQFTWLSAAEDSINAALTSCRALRRAATSDCLGGSWPIRPLADHTAFQQYGSSAKTGADGDVPILRMGNIIDGQLDFESLKYLPSDHPDLEKMTLERGDILFNRTNSPELVGKAAVFDCADGPVGFASYLIRVRTDDQLDPHWAATAINSPEGRRYVASVRSQQVGQANVNGTKLKAFPIPVPPIRVQRDRLRELRDREAWIERARVSAHLTIDRAAALRRSLLHAAFTGLLVSQDPDDEPASVLLERIRAERAAAPKPTRAKKKKRATT